MRVVFTDAAKRGSASIPKNLLAEAEVYFDAMTVEGGHPVPSPFASLKLVGFSIWKGDYGIFVTLPGRSFGTMNERRFFDYVRAADPDGTEAGKSALHRFKRWIVDEYKEWSKTAADEPAAAATRSAPNGEEF